MGIDSDIRELKGVGDAVAGKLSKLRIRTVRELLDHVPFRYDDYSEVITINKLRPGPVSLKVTFNNINSRYSKKGLHLTEAMASDKTGSVKVMWFNQPYRAQSLNPDKEYYLSGEFAGNSRYLAITNPACEMVSNFTLNTARLVPIYRLTKGLGMTQLRRLITTAIDSVSYKETLPSWILKKQGLMNKSDALKNMHFPSSKEDLDVARRRLGFEEIFELTLASELNKHDFGLKKGLKIDFNEKLIKTFVSNLDFKLTDDQRAVAWQIFQDMSSGTPMNRLIEGDVGSGKTIVAIMAAINAISRGYQVVFLAPTEILARQQYNSIKKINEQQNLNLDIEFLSGSVKKKLSKDIKSSIADGDTEIIVGTHAVFQSDVEFKNIGLVIVDEQHRFGVKQRKSLQAKAKQMPHVMNLTATPIPRTLALTLYGEMEVSIIKQKPPGRKEINTELTIKENRLKVYEKVKTIVDQGQQVYVVCPQIESSDTGRAAAVSVYKDLELKVLKQYKVGLLHGKMKSEEKDTMMQSFVDGEVDVLVSTTVIEVGVNVPNATAMVIESADAFGLAQLHQLRGRVGRGSDESYCYLIQSDNSEPTRRLQMMERVSDGFKLAEYDLEVRGPGAIYGTMQSGELDLRVAKLTDVELIQSARSAAVTFVQNNEKLVQYPQLNARISELRKITNLN